MTRTSCFPQCRPTARRITTAAAVLLLAIFWAAGSERAHAQCCDYVVRVMPGVLCPVTVNSVTYTSGTITDGNTYPPNGLDYVNPVPCPNAFVAVSLNIGGTTFSVPYGVQKKKYQLPGFCCVYITIDNSWLPAPCYYIFIEPAPCDNP